MFVLMVSRDIDPKEESSILARLSSGDAVGASADDLRSVKTYDDGVCYSLYRLVTTSEMEEFCYVVYHRSIFKSSEINRIADFYAGRDKHGSLPNVTEASALTKDLLGPVVEKSVYVTFNLAGEVALSSNRAMLTFASISKDLESAVVSGGCVFDCESSAFIQETGGFFALYSFIHSAGRRSSVEIVK